MNNFFKILRFDHLFKNILILVPLITIGNIKLKENGLIFLEGFVTISLVTLMCYLINDFCDQKIDKINKLKKKNLIKKTELYYGIAIFLTLIIFTSISFNIHDNYYIYLYFLNFFLYNFSIKKIKILDIIFLNNFYLIRILFGAKLFAIDISLGSLCFFYCLFMGLSLSKRLTQIQINNLKKNNKILQYSIENKQTLIFFILFFLTLSVILFALYIINNCCFNLSDYIFFKKSNYENDIIFYIFIAFTIWTIRVLYLLKKNIINQDFYKYFVKDKFSYVLIIVLLIFIY